MLPQATVPSPAVQNGGSSTPATASVRLLTVDPDLGTAVPADELPFADRVLAVPELTIPRGPWSPEPVADECFLGYVVVEGALAHEVRLAGDSTLQLLGPGDVVDPFAEYDGRAEHRWHAFERTRLAALDKRFVAATRKWPALGVALHRRLAAQAARASVHTALSQLGRVEMRVLALLWHLVDRWGVVSPEGVVVQLRLTHETLGRLVGARRPTVSLALKELGAHGVVTRRPDGLLVLDPASQDSLAADAAA